MRVPVHGGDLTAIGERYGVDSATLLDFSANVNPLGPPPAVRRSLDDALRADETLAAYPPRDLRALRDAIAAATGLTRETIVIGNGGAALLDAVVRALRPRTALVPQPAFSEYARAVAAAHAEYIPFELAENRDFRIDVAGFGEALRRTRPDLCIITNPHNPSGGLASREDMLALAGLAGRARVTCIVDEAFIDYAPAASIADRVADMKHLIVLRSLTKFYALAGMRVGYALVPPDVREAVEAALPSWPVTTLAAIAATAALGDRAYADTTLAASARDRASLRAALDRIGIRSYPSAANFVLLRLPEGSDGSAASDALVRRHGIVVRRCDDYRGLGSDYIRVAVRDEPANARLIAALCDVLASKGP